MMMISCIVLPAIKRNHTNHLWYKLTWVHGKCTISTATNGYYMLCVCTTRPMPPSQKCQGKEKKTRIVASAKLKNRIITFDEKNWVRLNKMDGCALVTHTSCIEQHTQRCVRALSLLLTDTIISLSLTFCACIHFYVHDNHINVSFTLRLFFLIRFRSCVRFAPVPNL